jgi:HD-GYP domain-containing protein (c-di-GMP phosphodiesterase class II)/DNA-binding CsgD family transcriptional regulator
MATPRLADVLASVSLMSDLGFALPAGESMRSAVVAVRLAERLGLDRADTIDAYYTALLQHLGCIGFAHESAGVYGDDGVVNAAVARMDDDDPRSVLDTLIRATTRGRGFVEFARLTAWTLAFGNGLGERFAAARCEVGRETARRLGLPAGVGRGLAEIAGRPDAPDGRGSARPAMGTAARIAIVAATVVRFHDLGGPDLAVGTVRQRSGRLLDREVASAFLDGAKPVLAASSDPDPLGAFLSAEPRPVSRVAGSDLAKLAAAVGDVADLKSIWTLGHSAAVARLAAGAATELGLGEDAIERVRLAAHLHDVGRVGVSTGIWERPGPLSYADREQVRLHPYHTERILSTSMTLGPLATLAGSHHERPDGSGYHRGASGRALGPEAMALGAADTFAAMTQDRPHRPALTPAMAADAMEADARAGRLDARVVAAVLAAAGLARPRPRAIGHPAGLSEREMDVLRLVARGLSNRAIAARLAVSPRTAEHHVQHIYTKIGASSRAAAALFAMEHDLLE